MGRSYWNTGESYKQPDASQLQRNARQTMKKEKAKGKQLEPVVIQGRTIVKSCGDRPGATIWKNMRILRVVWIGENVM